MTHFQPPARCRFYPFCYCGVFGIFAALRRLMCRHHFVERYGDMREDWPGGPRTLHEIYWKCDRCDKLATRGCAPAFVATIKSGLSECRR